MAAKKNDRIGEKETAEKTAEVKATTEEKNKAFEDIKTALVIRDYMPLEQKEIIMRKALIDMRSDEEVMPYTASILYEIALVFDCLLAYVVNLDPNIDNVYKDETSDFLDNYAILPIKLSDMSPKITNHFERITLVNNAKTERLTIDIGLSFHNEVSGKDLAMDNLVIIEVKRDGNTYSPILEILRKLRIHPSGFSKYCIGTALTADGIKRNRFNIRLRKINKITNHYA